MDHALDVLVFATGFETTEWHWSLDVTGRDGIRLSDVWKDGPEAYLGLTVSGFPNLFMLYGPNTNLGHNSITFMLERQSEYIIQALVRDGAPWTVSHRTRRAKCRIASIANSRKRWLAPLGPIRAPRTGMSTQPDETPRTGILTPAIMRPPPRPSISKTMSSTPTNARSTNMLSPKLDPTVRLLLEAAEAEGNPPLESFSPVEARKVAIESLKAVGGTQEPVHSIENLRIPGPDCEIPIRIYTPNGPAAERPALVYFHGGGWVVCDLDTHDVVCTAIAHRAGAVVVAVDYRLAPEHKFPAAVFDSYAATAWVASNAAAAWHRSEAHLGGR